jgi:hypothetical protein
LIENTIPCALVDGSREMLYNLSKLTRRIESGMFP